MIQEQDYLDLTERFRKLETAHAVQSAREEEKRKEREKLEKELTAEGVDIKNLDKEEARLQSEIDATYAKNLAQIDEFEKKLEEAKG